jgi:hypothetical protein
LSSDGNQKYENKGVETVTLKNKWHAFLKLI